ncbi:GAF domain-containing protein [Nocardioides panacis]|uniref:histidine kinase n=1 Tax=Nocardioides panacis TaxID=2849501 RepID=A0A975SY00_9ACTN|nr:GAF domain-containing protein [Nocardioides panacis]QWZ07921.1 GAF domain-containing protein [Nocardioides panacis]
MSTPRPAPRAVALPGLVEMLLDAAPIPVVAIDADGRVTYANESVTESFGWDPGELVGLPVQTLVPAGVDGVGDDGHDGVGLHKDGTPVAVEVTVTSLPVGDRGETWLVAGIVDLSTQRSTEGRLHSVGRAYLTLAQMNQAIVRAPDEATLYAETCRVAVEQGGYLGAWVGAADDQGRVLPLATAGVLDDYIDHLEITVDPADPRGRGPTAVALREGRPCYSGDFRTDPATAPWHELAAPYGIAASATLPLHLAGRPVAVLSLYSGRSGEFDEDMRALLAQVGENVSFALDGFAAAERLRHVAAQRSGLLHRLVSVQEDERARIAADLHDDAVQVLAAIDLRLGLLRQRLEEAAPDLVPSVETIQDTVTHAVDGLRQLLFDLEPPAEHSTCEAAIRDAAAHIFVGQPLTWTLDCADDVSLPEVERAQTLRIVKEALINVRKHAQATRVDIVVRRRDGGAEVTITDDGVGVDPDQLVPVPGHRGLETMRDRAEITGGWLRLEQPASGGTTLHFWIPGTS